MKLDSRVEKAKRMVSETVRLGRSRGLTNPEAMAEASELLGCTGSRIWTLLYRAETVKSISDAEFRRISNGYREAFRIRIESIRNKADYHDRVTYALKAGPELPLLPDSESNLAYLRRQTESIERTAAGTPLWRLLLPKRRPRKSGKSKPDHAVSPELNELVQLVQMMVDASVSTSGSRKNSILYTWPEWSPSDPFKQAFIDLMGPNASKDPRFF